MPAALSKSTPFPTLPLGGLHRTGLLRWRLHLVHSIKLMEDCHFQLSPIIQMFYLYLKYKSSYFAALGYLRLMLLLYLDFSSSWQISLFGIFLVLLQSYQLYTVPRILFVFRTNVYYAYQKHVTLIVMYNLYTPLLFYGFPYSSLDFAETLLIPLKRDYQISYRLSSSVQLGAFLAC